MTLIIYMIYTIIIFVISFILGMSSANIIRLKKAREILLELKEIEDNEREAEINHKLEILRKFIYFFT